LRREFRGHPFFFSSRRRHTRSYGDWSSDVCSSDLQTLRNLLAWSYDLLDGKQQQLFGRLSVFVGGCTLEAVEGLSTALGDLPARSEERRVGKEGRSRAPSDRHMNDIEGEFVERSRL